MNDYSKYIKSEYGFITDINPIVEENIIEVTTSKTKKGKPHVYELNKENIQKLFSRLEKQYELLIKNKDKILDKMNKEIRTKTKWLEPAGTILFIISLFALFLATIPSLIGFLLAGTMYFSSEILVAKHTKSFKNMIETYQYFIEHRHEIETLAKEDENIINEADEETLFELDESQKLVDAKLAEELFSIQLIDKMSLSQLKEMKLRYQISKSLKEDQYYYTTEEEENSKTEQDNISILKRLLIPKKK